MVLTIVGVGAPPVAVAVEEAVAVAEAVARESPRPGAEGALSRPRFPTRASDVRIFASDESSDWETREVKTRR